MAVSHPAQHVHQRLSQAVSASEFFNNLLGETLLAALDKLPEAYRTVVILVNVEGFTYDETAEVLGVAPGTVRSRMKRGRTLLQKTLWQQRPASVQGAKP